MTQDPVPPSPRRSAGETMADARSAAYLAMKDRIFLLSRPRGVDVVPEYLDPRNSGFALCGPTQEQRVGQLLGRKRLPVATDLAPYEARIVSAHGPMVYPDTLFGLDGYLDDMLMRSTLPVAFTPSAYVEAGESADLKAIRSAAQEIRRRDVVVVVALDVTWLRDDKVDQLIAVLKGISHPIALILGGQYNPPDHYAAIMKNLRRVYEGVGRVGLWRTDPVAGLDAMSHGALFAGIGSSTGLRHLIPPGQKAQGGGGGSSKPSIFVLDLMHYFGAQKLADRWANSQPLTCPCSVCGGRPLDRLAVIGTEVDDEARAHNAACWVWLWSNMSALATLPEREQWYADRIRRAHAAYESENKRIQQPKVFKPSKTLLRLAKMAETVPAPVTEGARTPAQ